MVDTKTPTMSTAIIYSRQDGNLCTMTFKIDRLNPSLTLPWLTPVKMPDFEKGVCGQVLDWSPLIGRH